jgi:death-on-curing protein
MEQRIDLGDYLLIAEAETGIAAEQLIRVANIALVESALAAPYAGFGDFVLFPEFHQRAAVLCSRLVRNHPLPDGNKRSALTSMLVLIDRNGHTFDDADQDNVAETVENLAATLISELAFIEWVRDRLN